MVTELGLPVTEFSTRISKFYIPTDSENKFNKMEIDNWLPTDLIWHRLDWEPAVINTTMSNR